MLSAVIVLPLIMSILGLFRQLSRALPRLAAGLMIAQIPIVAWACAPALRGVTPPADSGFGADGIGAAFVILTTIVRPLPYFRLPSCFPRNDVMATK
jgi:formate hydrogenlyase subunit 3/multisubunit Na+/H+ antiporter MnhD subunit